MDPKVNSSWHREIPSDRRQWNIETPVGCTLRCDLPRDLI